jgi:hypothetical protein
MLTAVEYKNGEQGLVEHSELDELIRSRKIKRFLRLEGWVTVGRDPIRHSNKNYKGSNRRSHR